MKRRIAIFLMIVSTILPALIYAQSEPSKPKSEKWFRLEPNEVYVAEFFLKPSEAKELELSSKEPLSVVLKTDANSTLKQGKGYVRLTQKGTDNSIQKQSKSYRSSVIPLLTPISSR
jgi:hypothetical protein